MKLKSLYIEDYKNIKRQTFDFSNSTGYIALIGLNGSGKSNLLEAIGLIFNGILNKKKIPFDYTIVYEHDGKEYSRKKKSATIDGKRTKNNEMLYPSSVIACYSGEDLRLWHMAFEDYYMHYFKKAIDNFVSTLELIYISKYCWNIALITLMSSEDAIVKAFLEMNFGITDLDKVEVSFEFADVNNFKDHQALKWINRIKDECLDKNGKATIKSILSYEMPLLPNHTKESTIFHYLYLLSQPKKNSEKGNPVDKYITKIRIENKGIPSFNLSEGHKKLILIECITKVLGNKESILLLDEPDAHVHIALKKEILNCINDFEGQTLLTTHSPIFANQMAEENVFPIIDGKILPQKKRALIQKIANNEINLIDSACVVSSKHLIVTEGPGDINYITAAIQACGKDDAQYKVLEKVSFVYTGGAKLVEIYNDEILSDLYDTLEKIVFVFDLDSEGREGAKQAKKLIDEGKDKIKIVFYNKNYPIVDPDNNDFYLEDMFPRNTYNIVSLPHIGGEPTYAQLKKGSTLAGSIKNKIAELYKKKLLKDEDYYSFKPFLRQLKSELGL